MTVYAIILTGMVAQLGFNGSKISISLYALESGANQFMVGVLVASYAVFPMLLSIPIGKMIDRVGPWLPLMIGMVGMALGLVLPPLVQGIAVLFVAGSLLGLAHHAFVLPIEATVGAISTAEKRSSNYAMLSMAWSGANFIGPIVAGFTIDHLGHLQVFWVLVSFLAAPMLIFLFKPRLLPREAMHTTKAKHDGSFLELWRMPNLRSVYFTAAVLNSAQNLFQFYFPIYGHSLGLSASAIGIILGVTAAAAFSVRGALPMLVKKWNEARVLSVAVFVCAFAYVLFPFVSDPYSLAAISFVLGLGTGCSNPLAMSLVYVLAPQGRAGESIGTLRAMYNFVHLVVPVAFGSMGAAFGFYPVFLSNSVMLGVGGWLMRRTRPPARTR